MLGARSASGCRAVTVAPHQNLFETGNPPRESTVCAPPPRRIAPSARPKPLASHGRGPAQPPGRSSPHVGARWPRIHSASLGGRKDVGKWPGSRRSWRVGTVRQDGGEIWEPQTGFFCLSTLRPLQPLRHDCIADTSQWVMRVSGRINLLSSVSPRTCGRVDRLCLQHSSRCWCFRRPGEVESPA